MQTSQGTGGNPSTPLAASSPPTESAATAAAAAAAVVDEGKEPDSLQRRSSSLASSTTASVNSSRRRRRSRRVRRGKGDARHTSLSPSHRRRRGGRGPTSLPLSTPQSALTLCCDAVTVQRSRGLVIDCVSGLFHGGRLTAVVNCCGTHSAFYLLNALAGQEEADEGNVLVNGTPVTAAAYQKRSVLIDEDFTAFEELTVRENLDYAASMRVSNATRAYTVDDILQQLLLVSVAGKVVRRCSLYVRRRLSLGKELLRNPTVIILDQPLEGLATHEAQQFLSLLQRIAAPAAADAAAEEEAEAARQRRALRHSHQHQQQQQQSPSSAAGTAMVSGVWAPDSGLHEGAGTTTTTPPSSTPTRQSLYTPRAAVGTSSITPSRQSQLPSYPATSPAFLGGEGSNSSVPVAVNMNYAVEGDDDAEADAAAAGGALSAHPTTTTERIVIISMTQPRWALLQYVDEVLLLEESRCAYCGPVPELLEHTLPVPPSTSLTVPSLPLVEGGSRGGNGGGGATTVISGHPPLPAPGENDATSCSSPLQAHGDEGREGIEEVGDSEPPQGREEGWTRRELSRPQREEFVHNLYRLASLGNGGLCRALGPNSGAVNAPGSRAGSNVTALRVAIDRYLQRCAAGELTLTGWQYSSPGGFVQLLYLFKYSALQVRNNILVDTLLLVAMIALGVVLAAIYGSQEGQIGIQNRVGILFFLVSTTFLQSILSAESTRREYLSFQRHRTHGYYPTWVFLTFRVATCALTRFFIASVFALVIFLISNFGMPWGEYAPIFDLAVILAITSFTGYYVVFFTCTFQCSVRVDALVLFAVYTVSLVLAGLVLNLNTLPRPIQYLSMGTVLRLSFESCVVTQFWGRSFGCELEGGLQRMAGRQLLSSLSLRQLHGKEALEALSLGNSTAMCYTGTQYVGFLGFDNDRRWRNVGAMAGLAGILILLSFMMMTFYRPKRRASESGR